MSSEQEASSMPDGSHLMALTSFCRTQTSLVPLLIKQGLFKDRWGTEIAVYRVSLEGLEGSVAAETAHVDAHVCTAGGEGGVVLPVHVQGWSCGMSHSLMTPTSTTTQENTAHDTTRARFTWVKRKLLLGFSCMCIPNDCRLESKKDGDLENSSRWKQNILNYTADFTLSTPALRIEFPFLFHLSANMGPLCCPKVLARFPNG